MSFIRFGSERRFIPGESESYVFPTDKGVVWWGNSMDDLVEICCRELEDPDLAKAVAKRYIEIRDGLPMDDDRNAPE